MGLLAACCLLQGSARSTTLEFKVVIFCLKVLTEGTLRRGRIFAEMHLERCVLIGCSVLLLGRADRRLRLADARLRFVYDL